MAFVYIYIYIHVYVRQCFYELESFERFVIIYLPESKPPVETQFALQSTRLCLYALREVLINVKGVKVEAGDVQPRREPGHLFVCAYVGRVRVAALLFQTPQQRCRR